MDIRDEIKSLIAKNGTTLKKVCEQMSEKKGKQIIANNIIRPKIIQSMHPIELQQPSTKKLMIF